MRRSALVVLSLPAVLLAADLFGQLGWEQQAFENTCFQFVAEPDRLPSFYPTTAMRALAVPQRKGAVEAIGARAKAYYASDTFKKRWAEHRASVTGGEEREQQLAQSQAQGNQMMADSIKQMEAMIPMLPPAQQEDMKKAIAQAKAQHAKNTSGEREGVPVKDPKVALKQALQHFLAATDGIDYGAALSTQNGKKYFASQALEAKPAEWKMVFRAGREAGEGARSYVKAWIAELK
jgi:hypothetical protein